MLRITRRVTIVRSALQPAPATAESLWERTPKIILCLLAVFFAIIGRVAGQALHGSMALEVGLGSIGGIFGFYCLKLWRPFAWLLFVGGALVALTLFGVWLEHSWVH